MSENPTLPPLKGEGKSFIKPNIKLAPFTWFKVGGEAEFFAKVTNKEQLLQALEFAHDRKLEVTVIGACSNLLIRDGGIKGLVIKLLGDFAKYNIDKENATITAGAAVLDKTLALAAAENGLGGLEFLYGVPGSVGGAVQMNAGCFGGEIRDVLFDVVALSKVTGKEMRFTNEKMKFEYRFNGLNPKGEYIFTEARFLGKIGESQQEIEKKILEIDKARKEAQPHGGRTGGSTFKNPSNEVKAWQLIDSCGLRGYRIGGAYMSEKHCNFLISEDGATAKDIEELGEYVRAEVLKKTGYDLHWEIKIVGQ